jgi:mono/diheme cytochrome c family protein
MRGALAAHHRTGSSLSAYASGFEENCMKVVTVIISTVAVTAVVAVAGMYAFAYSGVYDIGADRHHTKPVATLIGILRERSIERRAEDLVVPNLTDPALVLKGAGQYAAMCTACHLAPGMADNEMRPGLYPRPPNLSRFAPDPREAFWVIKHGIKMSAMPAWGATHDDPTIWSMVAFLQQMHSMTPEQYQDIVARAPADHDMAAGDHHHDGAEADVHTHAAAELPDAH